MNSTKVQTYELGLLGGAFDPFHNVHLQMAQEGKEQLNLNKVLLMPTFVPSHKEAAWLTYQQRFEILTQLQQAEPWLCISDLESKLSVPSYTIKTLRALHQQHLANPDACHQPLRITLLLGEDAYNSLQSWFEWQSLTSLCKIAVFPRLEGSAKATIPELPATWLAHKLWPLSSTFIRREYAQGHPIRDLVPAAVYNWLQSNASNIKGSHTTAAQAARPGITNTMTEQNTQKKPAKQELLKLIEKQLDDQKGKDIEIIDLKGAAQFADTMIVASGTSTRHVASLARGVCDKIREELQQKPIGMEGLETSEWVLVDFGDTIVHVMLPATRQFYELEKLWKARPDQNQATPEA